MSPPRDQADIKKALIELTMSAFARVKATLPSPRYLKQRLCHENSPIKPIAFSNGLCHCLDRVKRCSKLQHNETNLFLHFLVTTFCRAGTCRQESLLPDRPWDPLFSECPSR